MSLNLDATQGHLEGTCQLGIAGEMLADFWKKRRWILKTLETANGQVCLCWSCSSSCLQDSILGLI